MVSSLDDCTSRSAIAALNAAAIIEGLWVTCVMSEKLCLQLVVCHLYQHQCKGSVETNCCCPSETDSVCLALQFM